MVSQPRKTWQTINLAFRDCLENDSTVVLFGEDVASAGGPYGLSRGLLDRFGTDRVRDTPISESAIAACAVGAAMCGLRPIVDIMFADFLSLASNQIINQAAKYSSYFQDEQRLPLVIHSLYGGRASMGPQHSQSLEAWFCHVPGIDVVTPGSPQAAYDVLRNAIESDRPTLVLNNVSLLADSGPFDAELYSANGQLGRMVQPGEDVTLVTYGTCVKVCQDAVRISGVSAEIIDLTWLSPWDIEMVSTSLHKTTRLVVVHDAVVAGGWGAEIVAQLTEARFWDLDSPPLRVGAAYAAIPVQPRRWREVLPSADKIADALVKSVGV